MLRGPKWSSARERRELCEELTAIEDDLVKQLIRAYRSGTDYRVFWKMVKRVNSFSPMRREFSVGRMRESAPP